jgi:hypothetical protein
VHAEPKDPHSDPATALFKPDADLQSHQDVPDDRTDDEPEKATTGGSAVVGVVHLRDSAQEK